MYLNIEIKNGGKLTIHEATLNQKQLILKYKLIPTNLVNKIQSINLKNKSVWERLTFITDALKIIKENWLCGLGGNAWRTMQSKTQSYYYFSREVHCFVVQVFLENGILGLIACLGIGILFLKRLVAEIKSPEMDLEKISVMMAVIFLCLHSLLDFDLSFFYVLLVVFVILATMKFEELQKVRGDNVLCVALIIVSILNAYIGFAERYYKSHTELMRITAEWPEGRQWDMFYRFMPFSKDAKVKKYRFLRSEDTVDYEAVKEVSKSLLVHEKYMDNNLRLDYVYVYIEACLEKTQENLEKDLSFAFDYVCKTEEFGKYQPTFQLNRWSNFGEIIRLLEENEQMEWKEKFQEQLIKEMNNKENDMFDAKKTRCKEEQIEEYKKSLEELKERINLNQTRNESEDGNISINADL